MRLPLNWLKDYVDPKLSVDELVHRLTMAGLEVEEVHKVGKDTVLDLEITPNRPDCLNILGLAREISAITSKHLKPPKVKTHKPTKNKVLIAIEDKKDCSRYIGTLITGTKVDSSPEHIVESLLSVGLNSINNAVDVTNFVLMELGQPLHVFDYDKLVGGKVIVRRAKQGETIVTLDGLERKLDPSILIIADALRPIAIAGIMGGEATAVSSSTKNILLESAHFDMGLVRRASRKLGLKSDSSYRFERGVDYEGVLTSSNRATDLLVELTKGTFSARTDAATAQKKTQHNISLSVTDIEGLLGTKVSAPQVKSSLTRLGLKVAVGKKGEFKVSIPSFRGDLKQPVDIIEEIARVIGYDNLEVSFPHIQAANITPNSRPREIKKTISNSLVAQGFCETITYSLISAKDLAKCNIDATSAVKLQNFLSQEHSLLRPFLMPSLLSVAATNFNRGQKDLKLFEIGKRYLKEGEYPTLAILLTGRRSADWRHNSKDVVDFYDLKGVVQQVFSALKLRVNFEIFNHPTMDESSCAKIILNGQNIGTVSKVDAKVLAQWDIKAKDVYFAGIYLETLSAGAKEVVKYAPVVEFPAIVRDVSLAVKKDTAYSSIEKICLQNSSDILRDVQFIEQYVGDKISADQKALVFSLVYQSPSRTLREEEVNAVHKRIVDALIQQLNAKPR